MGAISATSRRASCAPACDPPSSADQPADQPAGGGRRGSCLIAATDACADAGRAGRHAQRRASLVEPGAASCRSSAASACDCREPPIAEGEEALCFGDGSERLGMRAAHTEQPRRGEAGGAHTPRANLTMAEATALAAAAHLAKLAEAEARGEGKRPGRGASSVGATLRVREDGPVAEAGPPPAGRRQSPTPRWRCHQPHGGKIQGADAAVAPPAAATSGAPALPDSSGP